jgi:signal transduction histidine kinase/ActR/RegA family two-component response regulator
MLRTPTARRRLALLALGILAAAAVVAAAGLLIRGHLAAATAAAVESWRGRLESAMEGRVAGLSSWADARLRDAHLVSNYPSLRAVLEAPAPARDPGLSHVRELLEALIRFQPFRAVYVLDANGAVITQAGEGGATPAALASGVRHLAVRRASGGGRMDAEGRWSADLIALPAATVGAVVLFTSSVPTGPGEPPLGAIVFEEDPAVFLSPHLAREVIASRTGEVLLLVPRRDSVSTIDPRAGNKPPGVDGESPVSRSLAELVSDPHLAFWEDVDRRGTPVLVMTHPVPSTTWVLLARVNRDEAVSPAVRRAWQDVGTVAGILLASLGAAFGLWRHRQAAYMRERLELEEQLRQSQKMEAIGRLAGGVAHDFNNLLTVISGYAEMARRTGDAKRRDQELDGILQAAERAARLTRQLLAFGRKQVLQPRQIDLNEIVRDIEKLLRRLIGEDVTLVVRLAPGPVRTHADRGQVEQMLVNLALNARDAMPEGGTLEIATAVADLGRSRGELPPEGLQPGRYVRLTVRDSGVGMTPDVQAHVFEPFFTTKPSGQGTGLGLSTVYGIVKQSGGSIGVESQPGAGTCFRVYLPWAQSHEERSDAGVEGSRMAAVPAQVAPAAPARLETVLVVEDNDGVRALVREALERAGYAVIAVPDAEEGQQLLGQHSGTVHLLLTDLVLPGMNGREFARVATATRSSLRVLYMSGYPSDAVGSAGCLDPGVAFIAKPFTPAAIAARVREVPDDPAGEATV